MVHGNVQEIGVQARAGRFWLLAVLLCGALTLGVRAQIAHVHQWAAVNDLPQVSLSTETPTGITGQTVALVLPTALSDTDTCLAGQGGEEACAFSSNEASNNVRPTTWSDGGAGGQFGYLDSYGQFTTASDPWMISHYQCPSAIGTVTLTVSYDDEPYAWEPWTGTMVSTHDDAPVSASCTLAVEPPPVHQHAWDPVNNLPAPTLNVWAMGETEAGDIVDISADLASDYDTCVNAFDCPFYWEGAPNQVVPLGWSDGGAGGVFGYMHNGAFEAATEASQVTHYQCPSVSEGVRQVTLRLTVDDSPTVTDPATGETISTHDDTPVTATSQLSVLAPHRHAWDPVDNLASPGFTVSPSPALTGSMVELQFYAGSGMMDEDRCLPARCSFNGGYWGGSEQVAYNNVSVTSWSDGDAGGQFGYQDAYGQFHEADHAWQVTHYLCPTEPRAVQLSLTVDDDPQATDPESGQSVPTYDDRPATAVVVLAVQGPPPHLHQWEAVNNLPTPQVWTGVTALAGVPIAVRAECQSDTDQCYTWEMTQPCPFPGGVAANGVQVTGWSDGGAGGQFGYLDELGEFVSSSNAPEITHYLPAAGGGMVGLTATVDDVPQAVEPGTGESVNTYDDQATTGFGYLEVQDASMHTHAWTMGSPLVPPVVSTETANPAPEQVMQLSVHLTGDWDECTVYDGCPLANRADNAVHVTAWSDGNSGGAFGYLDSLGTFVETTTAAAVTHYRCPSGGGGTVTLSATLDDLPQTMDPASGQSISTYDDSPTIGSATVAVTVPDHHVHVPWQEVQNLPQPEIELGGGTLEPGAVVPIGAVGALDLDVCEDPCPEPCGFPHYTADNSVKVTAWSDGGAGGEFGYLDAQGQFVSNPPGALNSLSGFVASTNPALVTHYRVPETVPATGIVTFTVTVDDIPLALEPGTARVVATYNDASVTGARTVPVTTNTSHQHNWLPGYPITGYLGADRNRVNTGERISLLAGGDDMDKCGNYATTPSTISCPLNYSVSNAVNPVGWSDGNAGGTFGSVSGGVFTPIANPNTSDTARQVTAYVCPSDSKEVTITVTLDDDPRVWINGSEVPTHNDPQITKSIVVKVEGGHTHDWERVNTIAAPGLSPTTLTPRSGEVVELRPTLYVDPDRCVSVSPPCAFANSNNVAMDTTYATDWSASVPGGAFGRLINGQLESCLPEQVTHYRCPAVSAGSAMVQITLRVNDRVSAKDPSGRSHSTYDDAPVSASRTLTVYANPHTHTWQAVHDIPAPGVTTSTDNATSRQVIDISATFTEDRDRCTVTSPNCSFPNNLAPNTLKDGVWSDNNGGGRFGYNTPNGFVETSLLTDIRHYECPLVESGTKAVTLTRTIEDHPQTLDPGTNQTISTFDDTAATGSRTITVRPGHPHQWQTAHNIPTPTLDTSTTQPEMGSKVQLTPGKQDDTDLCLTVQPACPFPNNTANNPVSYKEWTDHGAGGKFGKLVNGQVMSCPAAEVTYYQCPASVAIPTNVTLTLKVDDDPRATEPGGPAVGTFDDNPASVDRVIQVQPKHTHQWTSEGNQASRPVSLVYLDTEIPATSVRPCDLLEVRLGTFTPDSDRCLAPGCPFPGGIATETTEPAPPQRFATDQGGLFGTVDERGKFRPLAEDKVDQITHFQVGYYPGEQRVYLVLDDTARAEEPGTGQVIDTYNDQPVNGPPWIVSVSGVKERDCEPQCRRKLSGDDICQCDCGVAAMSSLNPRNGTTAFDVPVTGWSYRGLSLGFSLAYTSNFRGDPTLDVPHRDQSVLPQANLAHLSSRHSGWTHTWAQFVEVVEDETGEIHAMWHTGDGGVVAFDGSPLQSGFGFTWAPRDSYHSLTSTGTATTTVPIPRALSGTGPASVLVAVPYGTFTAKDGDGTTYEFTQVHWEKGAWTAVPHFLLTRILDRYGRIITLNWQDGYLKQVRDGGGRGLSFEYLGKTLSQVTDPFGRVHRFTYQEYLSEWGRPELQLHTVRVEGPGSPRVVYNWKFDYGTPTHDVLTYKREPSGKVVEYHFEPVALTGPAPRPNPADWDGQLRFSQYLDPVDGLYRVLRREGNTLTYPGGNRVTYRFDGNQMTGALDEETGRYVRYVFDTQSNLRGAWAGNRQVDGLWDWVDADNPPPGALVKIDYQTQNGRITKTTVEGPLKKDGLPLGDRTETEYNQWNQPRTVVSGFRRAPYGRGYQRLTEILSDAVGNATSITTRANGLRDESRIGKYQLDLPGEMTDGVGRIDRLIYDATSGLTLQHNSPDNRVPGAHTTDTTPSVSRVEYTEELPTRFYNPLNQQVEVTSRALYAGSSTTVVTVRDVANNTSRTAHLNAEGLPITTYDERSIQTNYQYNGSGQVVSVTEAVGRPEQRTTSYRYNLGGDLIELINAKGAVTRYTYHRYNEQGLPTGVYEGQVTGVTYPDGLREFYGYDTATGHLKTVTRMAGQVPYTVELERDEVGRVTQVNYPASLDGNYQASTHTTEYDEFGQVVRTSKDGQETQYVYDGLGRLTGITPGDGRKAMTFSYTPDTALHRWTTTVSMQGVTGDWVYSEDGKGRLAELRNPRSQWFRWNYDAAGRTQTLTRSNQTTTSYEYLARFLRRVTHRRGTAVQAWSEYNHDSSGRVLQETNQSSGHAFEYDALGRLVREAHTAAGETRYAYDASDNRMWVDRNGAREHYGYGAGDRLLWTNTAGNVPPTVRQSQPYSRYTYDDFGQLRARERRTSQGMRFLTFQWDSEGRLRNVRKTEGGGSVFEATYTADGERLTKTDALTGSHTYSFGLHDTNGNTVYTPGLAEQSGAKTQVYHHDWRGSTRMLTDNVGAKLGGNLEYDAYGQRIGAPGAANSTEFQFAGAHGYQREPAGGEELGLDYLYQRYYDPAIGRFISRDPIGYAGGLNLYGYCDGDPINAVDPSGLKRTGTYWGDVGEVFLGYGDALNPVNAWKGLNQLAATAGAKGGRAALAELGTGLVKGFTGWTSDDPREYGSSVATILATVVPAAKGAACKLARGKNTGTAIAAGAGSQSAPMQITRYISSGEKVADLIEELKDLMWDTGNEHAVVSFQNGQRAIVSGGKTGVSFLPHHNVKRIIGHIHPPDIPGAGPSPKDFAALKYFGQKHSYLYERGELTRFGSK